jgi:hypothetical protein
MNNLHENCLVGGLEYFYIFPYLGNNHPK